VRSLVPSSWTDRRLPRAPTGAAAGTGPASTARGALTILHLTHQGGGAGSTISIVALAAAQRAAGHRVLVGCRPESLLAAMAARAGLEVAPLEFHRPAALAGSIARLVDAERVDVVNSHASRDRAACRRARLAGRLGAACVMTRRQMPRSLPVSVLLNGFLADATIAVSRAVARALVRRGAPPWRVSVVPNGVDASRLDRPVSPAELDTARALAGWSPARATVGVVARRKDQDVLLRALALVTPPVTLTLVGVDPDAELLGFAGAAAARGHVVRCVPFRPDVLGFYRLFDVVVLPSRSEGLSQALLEAMALGLPVVASRAGGNVELIRHGEDGLLVPPREPPAFGAALMRLLADPALRGRLGTAARRTARNRYPLTRTAALTEAAYGIALARRP
jgi:glycosyltransferase involved in cell wall biosynthesis